MNNFEYIRNITIGQYLPLDSWVHRLDPRSRIVAVIFILMAAIFTSHPIGFLLCFGLIFVGLALARIPLDYGLRSLLPPLPFLIGLSILQIFINFSREPSPAVFQLGSFVISQADLWAGTALLLRFVVFILGLSLASFCISTSEITHGLEKLLSPLARRGLPTYDIVMVIQVTLHFLPFLAQATESIAKAQASRGQGWDTGKGGLVQRARCVLPVIVPLILISLRSAENLALAMDARGYGINTNRTSMTELQFCARDAIVLLVVALITLSAILL